MRAFPGLNREDFENDTYVFWDLKNTIQMRMHLLTMLYF